MPRRKRRYYDSYECVKRYQNRVRYRINRVIDYDIEDFMLNSHWAKMNRKRRSRVGFVAGRKPK